MEMTAVSKLTWLLTFFLFIFISSTVSAPVVTDKPPDVKVKPQPDPGSVSNLPNPKSEPAAASVTDKPPAATVKLQKVPDSSPEPLPKSETAATSGNPLDHTSRDEKEKTGKEGSPNSIDEGSESGQGDKKDEPGTAILEKTSMNLSSTDAEVPNPPTPGKGNNDLKKNEVVVEGKITTPKTSAKSSVIDAKEKTGTEESPDSTGEGSESGQGDKKDEPGTATLEKTPVKLSSTDTEVVNPPTTGNGDDDLKKIETVVEGKITTPKTSAKSSVIDANEETGTEGSPDSTGEGSESGQGDKKDEPGTEILEKTPVKLSSTDTEVVNPPTPGKGADDLKKSETGVEGKITTPKTSAKPSVIDANGVNVETNVSPSPSATPDDSGHVDHAQKGTTTAPKSEIKPDEKGAIDVPNPPEKTEVAKISPVSTQKLPIEKTTTTQKTATTSSSSTPDMPDVDSDEKTETVDENSKDEGDQTDTETVDENSKPSEAKAEFGDENSKSSDTNPIPGVEEPRSSHFMAYFLTIVVICIVGYVMFHNKQKILAFMVEGRKNGQRRRATSGGADYKKLSTSVDDILPAADKKVTTQNYIY